MCGAWQRTSTTFREPDASITIAAFSLETTYELGCSLLPFHRTEAEQNKIHCLGFLVNLQLTGLEQSSPMSSVSRGWVGWSDVGCVPCLSLHLCIPLGILRAEQMEESADDTGEPQTAGRLVCINNDRVKAVQESGQ